jgi:outer membrane protein W
MKNLKSNLKIKLAVPAFILVMIISSFSKLSAQVVIGPSYGAEFSNTLGEMYVRSPPQINISYFVNPNIALNLGLSGFGKALIDSSFNNLGYWREFSEMFSFNYYFLTSNVRPFIGVGLGHFSDAISNEALPKSFNINSFAIAGEAGIMASFAERLKLLFTVKYNYLVSYSSHSNVTASIGFMIPLKSR